MTTDTETYKNPNQNHLNNHSRIYNTNNNHSTHSPHGNNNINGSNNNHNKSLTLKHNQNHNNSSFNENNQSGFSDYYMPNSNRQLAMASIYKGIKNNDVSQILGRSSTQSNNRSFLPSINPKSKDDNFSEKDEVHNNLTEMRRQYDQTKNLANKREKELKELQEENEKLKERELNMKSQNGDVLQSEKDLQQQHESSKLNMQDTALQQRSYEYKRDRLKQDIQMYQKRVQIQQGQVSQIKQHTNNVNTRAFQTKQFNEQTAKMVEEISKTVEQEAQERERKIAELKQQIDSRQEQDRKREERMMKMQAIADHAMHDKDPQEKKWRQLCLVHKFVSKLLKDKMEREMKKFNVVETAFQAIKTATGVSESEEIVSKFLSREQTYGELLATIAESEAKIDSLKKESEQKTARLHELKQELVSLEMQQRKGKPGFKEQDLVKKMDSVEEKVQKGELLKKKLYQWSISFLQKHEQVSRPRVPAAPGQANKIKNTNYYQKFPRDQVAQIFEEVCAIFHQDLDEAKEFDVDAIMDDVNKSNVNDETQTQEFIRRNLRIQPKQRKQKQAKSIPSEADDDDEDNAFDATAALNSNRDSSNSSLNNSFASFSENQSQDGGDEAEEEYVRALRGELKRDQDLKARKLKIEAEKEKNKNGQNQ